MILEGVALIRIEPLNYLNNLIANSLAYLLEENPKAAFMLELYGNVALVLAEVIKLARLHHSRWGSYVWIVIEKWEAGLYIA